MKTCTRCRNPKPTTAFAKRSKARDGLASWCKDCFASNAADKYASSEEERQRKAANRRSQRTRNHDKLFEYLSDKSCVDCGVSDWRVLEFDHKNHEDKQFSITNALHIYSWENLLVEIEKCVIRCANCHRIRTSVQFGSWRSKRDVA